MGVMDDIEGDGKNVFWEFCTSSGGVEMRVVGKAERSHA